MHPDRVARFFAIIGLYLLLTVLGLRLISLINITWKERMAISAPLVRPLLPTIRDYTISPDGRKVYFQRQVEVNGETDWFSMPIEGGPATPDQLPKTSIDPFRVRNDRLYLLKGKDYILKNASPRDTRVGSYALSPDGHALAFAAHPVEGTTALYIMNDEGKLDWLGDHENISSVAWAPDNQTLAFIADSKDTSQVFVASRDGQELRQITSDSIPKTSLTWSPDGRMLAYVVSTEEKVEPSVPASTDESLADSTPTPVGENQSATPTPGNPLGYDPLQQTGPTYYVRTSTITVIDANGANPRSYLQQDPEGTTPTWGMSESGSELLYTVPLPENTKIEHLYAINPVTGKTRRVYPPQDIQALACPATIPGNQSGSVKVSIENSALLPADVHVLLRARPARFPATSNMNANIIRSESVTIPAGTTQTIEWAVLAQPGISTYISILINPSTTLPMDEERCAARNIYDRRVSFLPNLPYLSLALPLSAVGILLCVPWLRQKKKPALWVLYLAVPLLVIVMIFVESWIAQTHLS